MHKNMPFDSIRKEEKKNEKISTENLLLFQLSCDGGEVCTSVFGLSVCVCQLDGCDLMT